MRFNPELMRQILLLFESVPAGTIFNARIQIEGFSLPEINETAKILLEEGYFDGIAAQRDIYGMPSVFVCRHLNMKAHEFLANARNNTIWKRVLAKAETEGSSVSVTVLNALLTAAAKKYAGIE
jgi:hypothetical protein